MTTATATPIRASNRPLQRIAVDRPTLEHLGLFDPPLESLALADLAVRMDGSATFGGSLSAASGTFSGDLQAAGGTFGTITAGLLENDAGNRFIDLSATGTDPFIKHDNFELLPDGSADFGGEVSSDTFTTTGTATFGGRVFLEKSGRGKGLNHGSVTGTVVIPAEDGQVHRYSLSGDTTFQLPGTPTADFMGMTILVVVDHNGNDVTWESTSTAVLFAPGANNPSGTGLCVYALTCFDSSSEFSADTVWSVSLVSNDLFALPS